MEHNLKDIDVKFPLGVLTVVSGVSGSGKSSLVGDILYPALYRRINQTGDLPGVFRKLSGNLDRVTRVEYVDQNPIGKSSRSNAVTYLKVYDDIRKLLSDQQYAKINGYTQSFFSFNQEGGRCPECQGAPPKAGPAGTDSGTGRSPEAKRRGPVRFVSDSRCGASLPGRK